MSKKFPINIYFADDDEDDRQLFREALKKSAIDASLSLFPSCGALLKYLDSCIILPDLIFLDINMPILSGKECLKKLKEDAKFFHVPVIMYSTSATATDVEETFANGASLYVEKPFSFNAQITMFQRIAESYFNGLLNRASRATFLYKP